MRFAEDSAKLAFFLTRHRWGSFVEPFMLSPYFRRLSMNSFSRRFFGLIQLHASRDFRRHVVLSLILVQVGLHNSRVIGYCLVVRTCCHLFIGRQGESFMFRRSNFFIAKLYNFAACFAREHCSEGSQLLQHTTFDVFQRRVAAARQLSLQCRDRARSSDILEMVRW